MRFWTAHLRHGAAPAVVPEGFAWGACFLGPFWLAARRAWVAAALSLAAYALVLALTAGDAEVLLLLGLAVLHGLSGHDLRRWAMERRGFALAQVVFAHDETDALARLLERRPDLAGSFAAPRRRA